MLLLVLAAIGCYAMSLAPVTWVVISEIFPNRIRGAAMAVAVTALVDGVFHSDLHFPDAERRRLARRARSGFTPRFAWRVLCSSSSNCRRRKTRRWNKLKRNWWIE